eukprot:11540552-Alexandrium_andersonii.AAC.1
MGRALVEEISRELEPVVHAAATTEQPAGRVPASQGPRRGRDDVQWRAVARFLAQDKGFGRGDTTLLQTVHTEGASAVFGGKEVGALVATYLGTARLRFGEALRAQSGPEGDGLLFDASRVASLEVLLVQVSSAG